MASKFGGIPIEDNVSKFGGIPIDSAQVVAQQPTKTIDEMTPTQKLVFSNQGGGVLGTTPQTLQPSTETAATIATGGLSQPIAGYAGVPVQAAESVGLVEEGTASNVVKRTEELLQFTPDSKESQQQLKAIAELPIIKELSQVMQVYTDYTDNLLNDIQDNMIAQGESSGIPRNIEADARRLAVTKGALQIVPELFALLTGTKGAQVTAKAGAKAKQGIESTIKAIAGTPDVKVFDDATGLVTPEAIEILKQKQFEGVDIDDIGQKEIIKAVDEQGLISPDDVELLSQQSKAKKAEGAEAPVTTLQMVENYNLFKRRGVPVTRANVTQNVDDWRYQQDSVKESGIVKDIVTSQDEQLAKLANEGKENIGYINDDPAATNGILFDVVDDIATTYDNAVSKAYSKADAAMPNAPVVVPKSLVAVAKNNLKANTRMEGVPKEILRLLDEMEVTKKGAQSRKMTVGEAEKNVRQYLNKIYGNTNNPAVKELVRDLKDGLDADVEAGAGMDFFKEARQAKVDFHKAFGRDKVNKFEASQKSLVEDILTGKVKGDDISKKIISASPEQFDDVVDFFMNRSGDAGKSAWQDFKATLLAEAIEKARGTTTGAIDGKAVEAFNVASFEKTFNPLKARRASKKKGDKRTRFEAIFNPDEQALINDIIAIGKLRRPDKAVPQGGGPSGASMDDLTKALIDSNKGVTRKLVEAPVKGAKALATGVSRKLEKSEAERFVDPSEFVKQEVKKDIK